MIDVHPERANRTLSFATFLPHLPLELGIWAIFGRYVRYVRSRLPEGARETFMTRAYQEVFDVFQSDAPDLIKAIRLPAGRASNNVMRLRIGDGLRRAVARAAQDCLIDTPHGSPSPIPSIGSVIVKQPSANTPSSHG